MICYNKHLSGHKKREIILWPMLKFFSTNLLLDTYIIFQVALIHCSYTKLIYLLYFIAMFDWENLTGGKVV